jgi:signal-transduction protein with cAMP-binding, CBS, and nucleotidyltransferase domain
MMLRDGIRHLPVESNGKVVGVLSIRDVLAAVTAS